MDSQEKSHEVTWKSDDLEKFIRLLKEAKMGGDVAMTICRGKRKANKKVFAEIEEEALRPSPPEDQAGVIHAISPIWMKLGQIEGTTQKL